jgi:hypothetical protein
LDGRLGCGTATDPPPPPSVRVVFDGLHSGDLELRQNTSLHPQCLTMTHGSASINSSTRLHLSTTVHPQSMPNYDSLSKTLTPIDSP